MSGFYTTVTLSSSIPPVHFVGTFLCAAHAEWGLTLSLFVGRVPTSTLWHSSAWGLCLSSPACLFLSVWAHGCLLSTWGCYPLLLCLMAHMVWPSGSLSVTSHVLLTYGHHGKVCLHCLLCFVCVAAMTSGILVALSPLLENHPRAVGSVGEFALSCNVLLYVS